MSKRSLRKAHKRIAKAEEAIGLYEAMKEGVTERILDLENKLKEAVSLLLDAESHIVMADTIRPATWYCKACRSAWGPSTAYENEWHRPGCWETQRGAFLAKVKGGGE